MQERTWLAKEGFKEVQRAFSDGGTRKDRPKCFVTSGFRLTQEIRT
jgi:hypothetical protein